MRTTKCERCGEAHMLYLRAHNVRYIANFRTKRPHIFECPAQWSTKIVEQHAVRVALEIEAREKGHAPMEAKRPEPSAKPVKRNEHQNMPKLLAMLRAGVHVMLVGPAGSGKSSAMRIAAERLEREFYSHSCGPSTDEWSILGFMGADAQTYHATGLRYAFEHGGVMCFDEIDACNPAGLLAINEVTENGHASFPDKNSVRKHDDFVLGACANTYGRGADRQYVGRSQLDAATLDRFAVITWDYDEEAERVWAGDTQPEWVAYVQAIRKIVFDNQIRMVVSPRASIKGTTLLDAGMDRETVEDALLWKGCDKDTKSRILLLLHRA